jgi:hypothetical protein
VCAAADAEWFFDADAGAIFDSNLTGAASGPDVRSDWAAAVGASAGQFFALSGNDGLTLAVNVRGELYDRYHGLNLAAIGASARYRHKFGLGRRRRRVSLVVNSLYADYRSAVRTGARFDVRAELEKRSHRSIDIVAGVAYDRRYGPMERPSYRDLGRGLQPRRSQCVRQSHYDRRSLAPQCQCAVRRGDVESTSQQGLAVFLASDAIARIPRSTTPISSPIVCPGPPGPGGTSSYAFNDRASLNLQYAHTFTNSPQDLKYRSNVVGLVYVHRF